MENNQLYFRRLFFSSQDSHKIFLRDPREDKNVLCLQS